VRADHPGALPGFVGGEHSITPAIIEGLERDEMGIVWIDAHADLRQSFYGRPDNHACAAFNSLRFGPIVQIGVRALAEEEHRLLGESDRVRAFREWEREARDAVLALPDDVYLSLDMDGFAPEVVRAVGTPEPGGLYWDEVMEILDVLFEAKNVFAFDAVELCPVDTDAASEFIAARAVYKIMSYHAHHKLGGTAR
jgi:agmatinase